MNQLSTIGSGKSWTHRRILQQDPGNSIADFTANAVYQDFILFGLPAKHMIQAVKATVLVNFSAPGLSSAVLYIGHPGVFPANPTVTFVTNVHDCYGYGNLLIPTGSDDSYEYGSFRWFTISSPGSTNTISPAYCLPQRTDAHDVIARVVITGINNVKINQFTAGAVEIATQYGAF
jgi:hypothetical protein